MQIRVGGQVGGHSFAEPLFPIPTPRLLATRIWSPGFRNVTLGGPLASATVVALPLGIFGRAPELCWPGRGLPLLTSATQPPPPPPPVCGKVPCVAKCGPSSTKVLFLALTFLHLPVLGSGRR